MQILSAGNFAVYAPEININLSKLTGTNIFLGNSETNNICFDQGSVIQAQSDAATIKFKAKNIVALGQIIAPIGKVSFTCFTNMDIEGLVVDATKQSSIGTKIGNFVMNYSLMEFRLFQYAIAEAAASGAGTDCALKPNSFAHHLLKLLQTSCVSIKSAKKISICIDLVMPHNYGYKLSLYSPAIEIFADIYNVNLSISNPYSHEKGQVVVSNAYSYFVHKLKLYNVEIDGVVSLPATALLYAKKSKILLNSTAYLQEITNCSSEIKVLHIAKGFSLQRYTFINEFCSNDKLFAYAKELMFVDINVSEPIKLGKSTHLYAINSDIVIDSIIGLAKISRRNANIKFAKIIPRSFRLEEYIIFGAVNVADPLLLIVKHLIFKD